MRDHVAVYVNGRRHEVRGTQVFEPLSEFLRRACRQTGTKVVCAEGDCGSCTVLIGRAGPHGITYRAVTSCIQYMAQLDAAHVVTIEGLAAAGALNAVQQAMVVHHGAQCGFCTPGIVVTLCSLFDRVPHPSRHDVTRALVGNLCRCTGYVAIVSAALATSAASMPSVAELYPEKTLLPELRRLASETVLVRDGDRSAYKPAAFNEALAFKAANPGCTVLAGGTDLGVVWNKRKREPNQLLCLGALEELRGLVVDQRSLSAGAAVTLADLEIATQAAIPQFYEMLDRFGSPPIRNAGTLGGNIANGSPIGDTMPGLMVLDAEVELASVRGRRRVNINEFYTGYRQTVLEPDELIARVIVPLPADGDQFRLFKVSKRRDLDISTFAAAVWMRLDDGVIREARIAYGGVAATIVRLRATEAWLCERNFSEPTLREAGRRARKEIKPISDVRGSAAYRLLLAENILVKFFHDVQREIKMTHVE
ncbi:MAG TPA: xanthine dehydrogenase small subunit [Pirellulales bacterium]|nr:xanthine dehydrogenase small subunit [Pirellulales bacterium]